MRDLPGQPGVAAPDLAVADNRREEHVGCSVSRSPS
jgi:hypothetical protein